MRRSEAAIRASDARLGAQLLELHRAQFLVWAPFAVSVQVHLFGAPERIVGLEPLGGGYFRGIVDEVDPKTRYKYRLSAEQEFPDPASRFQPEGVHGPSAVISDDFDWQDVAWQGLHLSEYIFYELHVGTFTRAGTFEAVIDQLDYLVDLGITAIELMPVAQFPGPRNWGYDGVYPFAVQDSYGGSRGLKRLVNAAHDKGLAVVLDVVHNHLGPEGNYLGQFGPYFTDRYHTPWGQAINFDGEDSAAVRRFVIENARQWVTDFHIDALRLDAVHAIFDSSPRHILQELADAVHARGRELGRRIHVIAETDLNESRLVDPAESGGYGLDSQWSDDFHHALHGLLTKEHAGYYKDFGDIRHLAKALGEGFVYSGQFSGFRGRNHGTSSLHVPGERFVVFSQNHDQVGNRMLGERFGHLLEHEQLKLAAGVLLLSPFVPLLFMGQEYGELAPFLYFVSHSDPDLIEAVRQGRRQEFAAFTWRGEVPDAQAVETFERSRLDHSLRQSGRHQVLSNFYRELIRLRKQTPALKILTKEPGAVLALEEQALLVMHRRADEDRALVLFHFGDKTISTAADLEEGVWQKLLDSSEPQWMGPGSEITGEMRSDGKVELRLAPYSVCLLRQIG